MNKKILTILIVIFFLLMTMITVASAKWNFGDPDEPGETITPDRDLLDPVGKSFSCLLDNGDDDAPGET